MHMTVYGCVVLVIVQLQSVCSQEQYLPPLELTEEAESMGVHTICDDCSDNVQFNTTFPFGDYCHEECYINVNGIISFGEHFPVFDPVLMPGTSAIVYYAYMVAPFWADGDIGGRGNITWGIYTTGGSNTADTYLTQVSELIQNRRENVSFTGNWMMIVNYNEIPPYLSTAPVNTYQVILITDGRKSYAVYTYECGAMEWGSFSTIGFNAAGVYYANHELSDTNKTQRIACLALPSEVNNLIYDLVPDPDNVDCSEPTPPPPNSIVTCRDSGFDTCCVGTCLSNPPECYCDPTCHFFGDCCSDIDEICPRGNFSLGETHLIFANSYHINRISLDGSSFEILYDDPFPFVGGIVGLDYDYSRDYMYWSNVRIGTLNRAYLNGSNHEILLVTEDPSVYDLAVDWVNEKLYWTEELRGEVLVMDINTRRKTVLVANYNSSITRAIAVDPTTRYMYWTDWGSEGHIERAGMDGSEREVLHTIDLIWPNGITIDIPKQKIYWIDAARDTIEYSNVNGTDRILLERRDDEIFHPFSITLTGDFLFWTDWVQLEIYTTHKDLPNDNIVALDLFTQLLYQPHGIEAVMPERQPELSNPCANASCNDTSLCLLSPFTPEGYTCVCADEDTCIGPTPPPRPITGSCVLAGYISCCEQGLCRGLDVRSNGPASCTCEAKCVGLGTCCEDITTSCPEVIGLCITAGHEQCCPAGSGCTDVYGFCSCDEDCFDLDNCCEDAPSICMIPPTTTTPPVTEVSSSTYLPTTTNVPTMSPTPLAPPVTEVPGSVIGLTIVNISSAALRVTWSAPSSGGRVDSYTVSVNIVSGEIVAVRETQELQAVISGLELEVPYYVNVEAVNSIGTSDPSNGIAFTREGTPSIAPAFIITWTSLTDMDVSWVPLTLEEARGFITGYTVTYTAEEDEERRRQLSKRDHDSGSETVSGDQSSVTISGLDPDAQYSVTVAAETAAGRGFVSVPVIAPSAGILFQVHFLDVPSCDAWNMVEESERVSQIIEIVISVVSEACSTCNVQSSDIVNGDISLSLCDDTAFTTATFRALLLGDPQDNRAIIDAITKWVEEGGLVDLDDLQVKINSECDTVIESFDDKLCIQRTPVTPTATDVDSPDDSTNVVAIVVPIVIIIILIIIVAVLVAAIFLFRKRHQKKSDPYLNFDEQEQSGTARLSQNLYQPSVGPREYENPIYGEQEETKAPLEVQYLEDPSILK